MKLPSSTSLRVFALLSLQTLGCEEPTKQTRSVSRVRSDTAETRLGRAVVPLAQQHPGLSGSLALTNARAAFAARALLADAAELTLDVQYYIWRLDLSGTLLLDRLWRAAERGVRVRLLLDDNNTSALDGVLTALDAHPNIEVRLFNPYRFRRLRVLDLLLDFGRINRRMHNKSFTADNQVTIIGGRNVGDEYFGADQSLSFADLDLLTIGAVVPDVSRDFDRYWASETARPLAELIETKSGDRGDVGSRARRVEHDPAAAAYLNAVFELPLVRDLLAMRLAFEWASTRLLSDDPAKVLGGGDEGSLPWREVRELLQGARREVRLISPYFVPTENGVELFSSMAARGVDVAILTNALEATDVVAVHAGYAKRRRPLLAGGVKLYELKRTSAPAARHERELSGSSASSLHAKTFSVDGERLFVGSFNFDPRSARLNTELGFVVESPALAQAMGRAARHGLLRDAYELSLTTEGSLQWNEQRGESAVVQEQEPNSPVWKRAFVALLARLPIEWLL